MLNDCRKIVSREHNKFNKEKIIASVECKATLSKREQTYLSRLLSSILRHNAEKYGIALLNDGYTQVNGLLKLKKFQKFNLSHIEQVTLRFFPCLFFIFSQFRSFPMFLFRNFAISRNNVTNKKKTIGCKK